MYGLQKNVDVSFLTGRELIQVAIGLYQVIFAFDHEITISVEAGYEYRSKEGMSAWSPKSVDAAAAVVGLLGTTILEAHGTEDGSLALNFAGGGRLVILDASKEYESYQITRPGATIVV